MSSFFKASILMLATQSLVNVASADLQCPETVRAGSPLFVNATVKNRRPEPVSVQRWVVSLIGNSGRAGSSGLQGPFVQPLARQITVPQATFRNIDPCVDEHGVSFTGCNMSPFPVLDTEGTRDIYDIQIIRAVPGSMRGQLAGAVVAYIDGGNQFHVVGSCLVQVR